MTDKDEIKILLYKYLFAREEKLENELTNLINTAKYTPDDDLLLYEIISAQAAKREFKQIFLDITKLI